MVFFISAPSVFGAEPIMLSACQTISKPGEYRLAKDLSVDTTRHCLTIQDVSDVIFDCQGHTVTIDIINNDQLSPTSAVHVSNVSNFSIANCKFKTINDEKKRSIWMSIENIHKGTLRNLMLETTAQNAGTWIDISNSDRLTIEQNTLKSDLQIRGSHDTLIQQNIISSAYSEGMTPALIIFGPDGHHNTISGNHLMGPENPVWYKTLDDGVIIQHEHDDVVRDNIITGNFDCGIETDGLVENSVFDHNMISNSTICGIGGWYWNSWKGNTISNNIIDASLDAFRLNYYGGISPKVEKIYFQNNTFTNNIFLNPLLQTYQTNIDMTSRSEVKGEDRAVTEADFIRGNNRFKDNDFGASAKLFLEPTSIFVDDGGNRCASGAPLTCIATEPPNRPVPVVLPATIGVQALVVAPSQPDPAPDPLKIDPPVWKKFENKKFGIIFQSPSVVNEYTDQQESTLQSFTIGLSNGTGAITVYKKSIFLKERPWIAKQLLRVTKNFQGYKEDRNVKNKATNAPDSGPVYLQWFKRKIGGIPALDHRYASPGGVGRSIYVIRGAHVYEIHHDRGYFFNKKGELKTAPYKDFEKFLASIRFVGNKSK